MDNELIPSDVPGLAFQKRGMLVNTDMEAYQDYIRRRDIMQMKDVEIQKLSNKINNLENQLATIIQLLQNNQKVE